MADWSQEELRHLADPSRDPVVTDGDKYKVVLENEGVPVLEYRDSPGQRTSPHDHPDDVLFALSSFTRRLTHPDRRGGVREAKAGDVAWGKAQSHIGENVGDADTHVIIVELKARRGRTMDVSFGPKEPAGSASRVLDPGAARRRRPKPGASLLPNPSPERKGT